jgi:chromate transporter
MTTKPPSPPEQSVHIHPLQRPKSKTDLFLSFTAVALQGFGGVLSVIQREMVEKKRWLTQKQFVEDWAVAQILPGPNVVNLSLMLGNRYFGWPGALAALTGMLLVPTVLVVLLALLYAQFAQLPAVAGAVRGLGAAAAGLIGGAAIKMLAGVKGNAMGPLVCWLLIGLTFITVGLLRWPLIYVVLGIGIPAYTWAWVCLRRQAQEART